MRGDNSPPEVTVTVVDEGEDVAGSDEPEVVTMVGIEVTMVTRVGADPIDDDVSFLLTETGTDPVVVEDIEPLGRELTKIL